VYIFFGTILSSNKKFLWGMNILNKS
jgi:hypothetical protein